MSEIKLYKRKPIIVEAIQWDGTFDSAMIIFDWIVRNSGNIEMKKLTAGISLKIKTLEGYMVISKKDWVIKGTAGEFYPCKPDIFKNGYSELE